MKQSVVYFGYLDRKWKHLNCWLLVVTRRIHCWIIFSSNYTPGRATGRANCLMPGFTLISWIHQWIPQWTLITQLVLTRTGAVYGFPQLMHTYVMSSIANNSQSVANRETWPTGRYNSTIKVNFCTIIKWQWSQWPQHCSQNLCAHLSSVLEGLIVHYTEQPQM